MRYRIYGFLTLAAIFWSCRCPAPAIYRPGEGWTYEAVGGEGKWQRNRAKDQLDLAHTAFEKNDFSTALKAAHRVVKVWPLSDYAGEAQYLIGRCYEEKKYDERAFKEYQKAITKYPKATNYTDILERQSIIADRFLAGQRFKAFGYVPMFPSMDRTAKLYSNVVHNGPFHSTGPKAQINIGEARERQKDYPAAVKAYTQAADRYQDRKDVAADATFRAGMAMTKQAKRAEYDQNVASEAINTFGDFKALYPSDARVDEATKATVALKTEQARGAFETAKFYERYKKWQGAVVYYNEVLVADPNSQYAQKAKERIEALKTKSETQAKARETEEISWREAQKARRETEKNRSGAFPNPVEKN